MSRFFNSHLPVLAIVLLAFWTSAQTVSFALSVGNVTLTYSTAETSSLPGASRDSAAMHMTSGTSEQQDNRACFLTCFSDTDFCSSHCSATLTIYPADTVRDWRIQRAVRDLPNVLDGVEVPVDPAPPKAFI
ncbi:hypothetical protein K1718_18355 [Roseibium porphyridii]|uniref:Uncharacterized protein n=1 Tax=Roseibium porphyridii TaxID=2866279 RepID=A0ABY8EYE3_9HYPH|nr:hypothetical protein [Roseibium sp. KMA01]WFE88118.1 hypothetical protein K1718_18355 [Roseibium sp. KMA01]